ncbi:MAG: hypothetical protein WC485_09605, partial [Opitutaceae bacterium]
RQRSPAHLFSQHEVPIAPGKANEAERWEEFCRRALATLVDFRREVRHAGRHAEFQLSRDLDEALGLAANCKNPAALCALFLHRMRQLRACAHSPFEAADYARDYALFCLLLVLPLRVRTLLRLKVGRHLVENGDGRYRLKLSRKDLKNGIANLAKPGVDVVLPGPVGPGGIDVNAALRDYLTHHWPQLPFRGANQGCLLFPSLFTRAGKSGWHDRGIWERMRTRTAQLLHEFTKSGFGPHAIRHLLAGALRAGGHRKLSHDLLLISEETAEDTYGQAWGHHDIERLIEVLAPHVLSPRVPTIDEILFQRVHLRLPEDHDPAAPAA